MLFTSLPYALFLAGTLAMYWFILRRNLKMQNTFLLICSYIFYGWWDYRFLFLLLSLSLANYGMGIAIAEVSRRNFRRILLMAGLALNLSTLVVFKYYGFFLDGLSRILSVFGMNTGFSVAEILLPAGISFYVFLSVSYLVDTYRRQLEAERNVVNILLSFSFFPIILAGPIQRPVSLLPQIRKSRVFEESLAKDGLRQILYGLTMKIVIADTCAPLANRVFDDPAGLSGSSLLAGAFFFAVQIYADFAGYSHIAIGTGKLLGFRLMQNFAYPYFAKNIREFWQRWNISLTGWFRDYVFLPVAYAISRKIRSDRFLGIRTDLIIYASGIAVTWTLTGLWHGARFTFIVWGLLQGLLLVVHHLVAKPRKRLFKRNGISDGWWPVRILDHTAMAVIILVSWIFFRSNGPGEALLILGNIFSASRTTAPVVSGMNIPGLLPGLLAAFFLIEWLGRKKEFPFAGLETVLPRPARWAVYYTFMAAILYYSGTEQQFIYFRF